MENKTTHFLSSINEISQLDLSEKVIKRAKQSLLDYLCVTLAGASFQREKIERYVAFADPEPGNYTAIGVKGKYNGKEAVFLNGLNAHALDFDDGTNAGIIHLGSPIFSVLLMLAEKYGYSCDDVLRAAVIGYEVSFTMAVSIQPIHKSLGYHATGTCGVLGSVVAGAYLLGFSTEELYQAFATACVSASGMLNVVDVGSELKPYNVAKASLLALVSLQMSKAGFQGHPDPLGNERGFLKMMTGNAETEIVAPLLDGTYAIEKAYIKPYAACRYCHPSIEAAINIRNQYGVSVNDIKNITVRTYYWAVNKHDHTEILSSASAKMSIPYSVAVGLICGKAGVAEYNSNHIKDKEILSLTRKVSVVDDKEMTAQFPKVSTAELKVCLYNEKSYTKRVDFAKGEPENPLSDKEFYDKYIELCCYAGVNNARAEDIYRQVMENSNDNIIKLISLL